MFLRVSSLPCASHVDGNLALRLPLPRPSTRCGVVNPQKKQVVEGREVGGGCPDALQPPPASTTSRTALTLFSAHFAVRAGGAGGAGEADHPTPPRRGPAGAPLRGGG